MLGVFPLSCPSVVLVYDLVCVECLYFVGEFLIVKVLDMYRLRARFFFFFFLDVVVLEKEKGVHIKIQFTIYIITYSAQRCNSCFLFFLVHLMGFSCIMGLCFIMLCCFVTCLLQGYGLVCHCLYFWCCILC